MSRVIIVGGGIIGAACAYYLSGNGWKVTILDRGTFGQGCSHANCGFVCPSHVLPLATPGAVGRTLRAMLTPNSPFSIKPRLSLSLFSWLWAFARRCNVHDMMNSARAIQALLTSSRALYDDLLREEMLQCEWQPRGLLFVFQTPEAMHHYAETDHLLRTEFSMPAKRFDGPELERLEPALRSGLAGGWLYESDAHLRPDRLMSSLRQTLENRGVEIREYFEVHGFTNNHRAVSAVETTQGAITCDAVVVAAGAWTPLLGKSLGGRLPIQPGKGYSITMARPSVCPSYPLIFEEHRVAVTPFEDGYRIGSTMEFAGYDTTISDRRLELLRDGASHYLREPVHETVQEEWFGWRPMTPDSRPIIGRAAKYDNVWIAAGHGMLGVSMAPATGKLIAEMLDGRTPHVDPVPYSPERF
ncbi:MAG: FAD-dependent oxidoreductase [Planctomycetes bacterium]|nr:FAD-dependent oxidoreductase [Planctomycetota bacterium]